MYYSRLIILTSMNLIFNGKSQLKELLKDKKMQRFRVIYLIEFIQSNNFHIYSIFFRQRFTQNVTLKSKILTKSTMV